MVRSSAVYDYAHTCTEYAHVHLVSFPDPGSGNETNVHSTVYSTGACGSGDIALFEAIVTCYYLHRLLPQQWRFEE